MEEQAFRNGEFDLKSAKDVILKSSVHHESYNILNNKKGPLSACLVVSLHLDERVLKEDKINLYNWCVENQKSLGFDIEALGSKSQAALDP